MHFNLRCPSDDSGVSAETARRWLRGSSMPDPVHNRVLVTWLGLDLHRALGCPAPTLGQPPRDPVSEEFLSLLPGLSAERRQAVLSLLKLIVNPPSEPLSSPFPGLR